ncbi:MAG: bifunctional phosphoribosylaminoimidazolecarboxamide formyltransferase/IMP cyclohydrolase [Verrucomicrobia bacterium]|nr:bifunctional phosphoribosylaminoimidazolecarboxamide formyltransferase/IMP cyclohydrolase [Verrucomicrobiota bacterium]
MKKIERALISVSDKTGVIDFARELSALGVELLSTGGTAKAIRDAGIAVKDISEFTGFPEMLDGRVKTLHPKVHAGLLYLRGNAEHEATMKEHDLGPIDLVCVNLYPFEQTVAKPDVTFEDAIENIDIGGPTMIRSAAKNMKFVTVVTDPADYGRVIASIKENGGDTTEALRLELGRKVFARVAMYNTAIAAYLAKTVPADEGGAAPLVLAYTNGTTLRYGENPHQNAVFYKDESATEACIAHTEILHGKEMSYNNYVDGEGALEAVKDLSGVPACAIIKHTNPCGYATGETLAEAIEAAWAGDPVSAFGSVIAVTVPVDLEAAQCFKGRFVEALIAPDFEPEALEFLRKKSKDLRLLKLKHPMAPAGKGMAIKQINGGMLAQDRDVDLIAHWNSPTEIPFPEEKRGLAEFGVKACKHVKSNAIMLVHEYKPGRYSVLGMGAGQPNRVDSVRKLAVTKALENIKLLHDAGSEKSLEELEKEVLGNAVLISDAFFPFPDNIHNANEAGIRFIVEPGGSKRDEEVIAACDQYGIAMAFTGMRHFKH